MLNCYYIRIMGRVGNTMEEYLLVIEVNSNFVKAIIKDETGTERQKTQKELKNNISENGWTEADANGIWISTMYVILDLVKNCSVSPENIQKINILEDRETVVLWGKRTGIPVCSAIFEMPQQVLEEKKAWLLKKAEKVQEKDEIAIDTVASWIAYRLTGEYTEKNILHSVKENYRIYGDTDPTHFFGKKIPVISILEGL